MKRIVNLAVSTACVAVVCSNVLATGIVNGDFEQVSTCPWEAFKLPVTSPPFPVVLAPDGNPCSFLRIETNGNDDSAIVRQRDIPTRIPEGEWLIVEFDARGSGENPSLAIIRFSVTGAPFPLGRVIPDTGDWVHYILAIQVTDLDPNEEQTVDIEFAVFCENRTLDVDNVECRRSLVSCDPNCSDLNFGATGCIEADVQVDLVRIDPPCCPADLDGDGTVGIPDLILLLGAWTCAGPYCGPEDLDGDMVVCQNDVDILLANWGPCGEPPQQVPIEVLKCLDKWLPTRPTTAAQCLAAL